MIPTREQLEQCRHIGFSVYDYFSTFCDLNCSCDDCDRLIRWGCKAKQKIERIQTKRILRICKPKKKRHMRQIKRAFKISFRALTGVHSPSLLRCVRISDIWKTPNYED